MLSASFAKWRPSLEHALDVVGDDLGADRPGVIAQISWRTRRRSCRLTLANRVGLVVTPSRTPQRVDGADLFDVGGVEEQLHGRAPGEDREPIQLGASMRRIAERPPKVAPADGTSRLLGRVRAHSVAAVRPARPTRRGLRPARRAARVRRRRRLQRGADEAVEQRVRPLGAALELGVELARHEPGVIAAARRSRPGGRPATGRTGSCPASSSVRAVVVVDLEAVAVALVDDLLAVGLGGLRAGRELAG